MPNIPTYNAQDPESVIRIPDIAAEAWSSAARNIGRLGQEGAEATRRGFNEAAQGLKEFGQKLEQHKDAQDQLKLTNGLTDMELRHEQQRQALMTDPNISPADLPSRLNDAFQQHMGEMQTFGQQFGQSSDKIREEVAKQTGDLRLRMFKRHEADSANAAGASAEDSDLRNFNNNTALLGTNGTAPSDVDNALAGNERARQARLGTPGLNFQQRKLIGDKYDKYGEAYVKSGIETLLQKDPSRLPEYMDKWQSNISPEMRSEFQNRARAITRQKAMIGGKDEADQIVNQLLGQPPGQSAPLGGTAQPGVGGPARGLGGPSKFIAPQPGEVAPGPQSEDDPRGKIPVIRHYFSQNGINPDTAVAVARTEGLARFENPDEPSFASFQLNMDGGLGNKFQQETGLDPRDPANEDATIKWTAENWRRNGGWEPFHGAANNGINRWDGAQSGYRSPPTTNIASSPPPPVSPISGAVRGGAVAVGDSISAGLIRHGGVSGKENRNAMLDWSNGNTAAGSSPPDMIAENMKNLPDETFKGRPVIISTGASNAGNMNPADAEDSIREQIQIAKDKGATSITILGVGPKVAHWNATLEQIAKDEKVQFGGPIRDASDGIHPTNYRDYAHSIPLGGSGSSGPASTPHVDLSPYATGNAVPGGPSGVEGIHPEFASRIQKMVNDMPPEVRSKFSIISGFRSPDREAQVYREQHPGQTPPTDSYHSHGMAVDLGKDPDVLNWVEENGDKYGVGFTIADQPGEQNHLEPTENGERVPHEQVAQWSGDKYQKRYAQATPQTMTDAAPAGAGGGGGGGSVAATPPLSPKMVYPTEQAIFEARMSRMPDVLKEDVEGRVGWETQSRQIARDAVSKYKLITENTRKALENELTNGLKQLETGEDFNYREDTIRAYLDPAVADKRIQQLSEAKDIGGQIGKIRQTPVNEIIDRMNFFADSLQTTETEGFTEHNKMVRAYAAAAMKHLEGLGMAPGRDNSKADPAHYLLSIDPDLRAKYSQNLDTPDGAQDYATSMLSRQQQLGVPEEKQHILPTDDARRAALQITGDPEHAAQNLTGFYHRWGEEFPKAWSDLVTQGRLPETYQLMATLDDPKDQFMLARGLSLQASSVPKPGAGETAGKTESFWEGIVGNQQYKAVRDAVQGNDKFTQFEKSVMASSPNVGDQVKNLRSAVETLAFSNLMFDPNVGDAGTAASKAIQSAISSKYEFLGLARVPTEIYPSVSRAADDVRQNLNLRDLQVPRGVGKPGQPSAETWLATVKASPTWITNRTGDGIVLMDGANRKVIDSRGEPIMLRFSNQRTTPRSSAPAQSGAYDMTGMPF